MKDTAQAVAALIEPRPEMPFDRLFRDVTVVDVITGELRPCHVGVSGEYIAYVGEELAPAVRVVEGRGRYLAPGFMDAHIHTEVSMLGLPEFARAVLARGTTAVFADPHEIANVFGLDGFRLFVDPIGDLPLRVYLQVPSCVPNAAELEGTGGALSVEETDRLLDDESVVSLGEIPVSRLLDSARNAELLSKIASAHARRKPINGHAPATGRDLARFVAAGPNDDHTCISLEDGIAKIRAGMWIMIKESSLDKNLEALQPLLERFPHRCTLCTDDLLPDDLLAFGHMDHLIRKAIQLGTDPARAIGAATFNTAQRHHLEEYVGSVTPGRLADLVLLADLETVAVEQVYVGGQLVAEAGQVVTPIPSWELPAWATDSVRLPALTPEAFLIPSACDAEVRIIEILAGGGARNRAGRWIAKSQDGFLRARNSVNHLSMINRYGRPRLANAFCRGFDIAGGAIASTIAHDHHNLAVVGDSPESMWKAAQVIDAQGGGLAVVRGTEVVASLPLPVGGLMAEAALQEVATGLSACSQAARELGCLLDSPFVSLSFIGLPTMPDYGLTDRGLVDVDANALVQVIVADPKVGCE